MLGFISKSTLTVMSCIMLLASSGGIFQCKTKNTLHLFQSCCAPVLQDKTESESCCSEKKDTSAENQYSQQGECCHFEKTLLFASADQALEDSQRTTLLIPHVAESPMSSRAAVKVELTASPPTSKEEPAYIRFNVFRC